MQTHDLEAVAAILDVSRRSVEEWIARGELVAVNVSRRPDSQKPRLRVSQAHLEKFMADREVVPALDQKLAATRRRRRAPVTPSYI